MKESQGAAYNVLLDKEDLDRWEHSDFALGLFSMSDMDYVLDRDETKQPSLDSMVKKAIHRLKKNPEGFFLMVEVSCFFSWNVISKTKTQLRIWKPSKKLFNEFSVPFLQMKSFRNEGFLKKNPRKHICNGTKAVLGVIQNYVDKNFAFSPFAPYWHSSYHLLLHLVKMVFDKIQCSNGKLHFDISKLPWV